MVTRKASLPYPMTPGSPPSQQDRFGPMSDNHMVDASDLPPVPQIKARPDPSQKPSFLDNDNPWADQTSPKLRSDRPMPDFLKPRHGRPKKEEQRQDSLQNIPDVLRPGNSGQDTPRSSSEESRGFWEDDEAGSRSQSPQRQMQVDAGQASQRSTDAKGSLPSPGPIGAIRRKPLGSAQGLESSPANQENDFASNNPFRRASNEAMTHSRQPSYQLPVLPQWGSDEQESEGKGKQPVRDFSLKPSIEDFSKVAIQGGTHSHPAAYEIDTKTSWDEDPWKRFETTAIPSHPQAPPPPVPQQPQQPPPPVPATHVKSPVEQPPLIPISSEKQENHNPDPWASNGSFVPISQTQSPIPFNASQQHVSQYNDSLLDRGQESGAVLLRNELKAIPDSSTMPLQQSQPSLLDDDDLGPPLPARRSEQRTENAEMYAPPPGPPPSKAPPSKPPRPAIATKALSEAQIAKNQEDRNETYQIKHFSWFDHSSGRLRQSSMLTQNQNGPCPLLALVNALILGAGDESQASLDDALRSREQVSLGLIIETLMYELVTRSAESGEHLPDVDELNAFLMRLRTGMNANPKFVVAKKAPPNIMDARNSMLHLPQAERAGSKAGTFEATLDMKLYGAFSVPLLHGWLPESDSDAASAFHRSAPTYEDAQALQFNEEELEYKLSRQGLTPEEQRVYEDISSIKNFLKLYPTQLTPHGLESVQESLQSGSFAIMFRNDHFSTIYKHPQSGQIFTLITDAGYADRDEIIWESLIDVNGSRNEFFSGDFMPVSHNDPTNQSRSTSTQVNRQQHLSVPEDSSAAPLSPLEVQEQHDADFAMALQMQEEEEQRQRRENAQRRRSGTVGTPGATSNPNNPRGRGEIPIRLTTSNVSQSDRPENRPLIPPRNSRSNMPAVHRPADDNNDDAPPAYEEAAKSRPYVPPMGSPLHPGSGAAGASNTVTPMSSNVQLPGPSSDPPRPGESAPAYFSQGDSGGRRGGRAGMAGRRMSAYNETQYSNMPGGYWRTATAGGPGGAAPPQQQQAMGMGRHSRVGSQGMGNDRDRECIVM